MLRCACLAALSVFIISCRSDGKSEQAAADAATTAPPASATDASSATTVAADANSVTAVAPAGPITPTIPATSPDPVTPPAPPPDPYTAVSRAPGFALPRIILQYDAGTGTGADWTKVKTPKWYERTDPITLGRAASYLQEGIRRMTGQTLDIESGTDLSSGIILVTAAGLSAELRDDQEVQAALAASADEAANVEAFFLRSEPSRLLVIGQSADAVLDGVAALLESVDYEVLGMGPHWIHAPDHHSDDLIFRVRKTERPSFYMRELWATSGQAYGVGTIANASDLTDPQDEVVDASYKRWLIGTRMYGKSVPAYLGHTMQNYHLAVLSRMRATGTAEGFLAPGITVGPSGSRPVAGTGNTGCLWVDGAPGTGVYISNGTSWVAQTGATLPLGADVSSPLTRDAVLQSFKDRSEQHFAKSGGVFTFADEPEDGTAYARIRFAAHPQWYPDYLASRGVGFGADYPLHGWFGIDQPQEIWDSLSASDFVFGFDNWLLREYDAWIDTLPPEAQVTADGTPKKQRVRISHYSYNYHDVPPDFRLDQRIRVMIADFPKHRGTGKWQAVRTHADTAAAFSVLVPNQPSGSYDIFSFANPGDKTTSALKPRWLNSDARLAGFYRAMYDANIRAQSVEMDFNFGRYGLSYYLASKMLWNVATDVSTIRARWLDRSFGSAAPEMRAYFDFMSPEGFPVNGPNAWGRAIRLLDAAAQKLAGTNEADAQQRVDDLRQFWIYYYLGANNDLARLQAYVWKGQMAYVTAIFMVTKQFFSSSSAKTVAGPYSSGPAHYTHQEIDALWNEVLAYWPYTPLTNFRDGALVDGTPAASVDLFDLVLVKELDTGPSDTQLLYNSTNGGDVSFLTLATRADDTVGFSLWWPWNEADPNYAAKLVPWGHDYWDAKARVWIEVDDVSATFVESTPARANTVQSAQIRQPAGRAGVHRFVVGPGGNMGRLGSSAYEVEAQSYSRRVGQTFYAPAPSTSLSQEGIYFYIPRGTPRLDFETEGTSACRHLLLKSRLDGKTRDIDISAAGANTIALLPGEDGSVARVGGNPSCYLQAPYLYSVPFLWAKSPRALLVPRAIAVADGLTIEE